MLAGLSMAAALGAAAAPKLDTAKIEELTGAKGSFNEKEGVFKVSFRAPTCTSAPPESN